MTRKKFIPAAIIGVAFALTTAIIFATPQRLNYQGYITQGGLPMNGPATMEFRLFSAVTGGAQLCSTNPQSVTVTRGRFSYEIGSEAGGCDLAAIDWAGSDVFLEVVVGGQTLTPRERVVPAAMSLNSDKLGGQAAAAFATSAHAHDGVYIKVSGDTMSGALTAQGGIVSAGDITAATGTVTAGAFVGDGAGLTNLPVAGGDFMSDGSVPMSGALTVNNTITATGTVTAPLFDGAFDGDGSLLTSVDAATLGGQAAAAFATSAHAHDGVYIKVSGDTMSGALTAQGGIISAGDIAAATGTVTAAAFVGDGAGLTNLPVAGGAVAKTGDTMSGALTVNNTITATGTVAAPLFDGAFDGDGSLLTSVDAATLGGQAAAAFATAAHAHDGAYIKVSGDTMSGALTVANDVTVAGDITAATGTVTAAAFVGDGAGLTNLPVAGGDFMSDGSVPMTGALAVAQGAATASLSVEQTGPADAVAYFKSSDPANPAPSFVVESVSAGDLTQYYHSGQLRFSVDPQGNIYSSGTITTDAAAAFKAPADGYINFGATTGAGGYGFRDSAGTLEYKNGGGGWAAFGGGGGDFMANGSVPMTGGLTVGANTGAAGYDVNFYGTYNGYTESRMFWDASKSAFRAGLADGGQWDNANVGAYSFASGYGTTASESSSTAMGEATIASGYASTAMGSLSNASGVDSTAMGSGTNASADYSTAMGFETTAINVVSTAMGFRTTASGENSTAMGEVTIASGYTSTTMGSGTTASADYSTAMGVNTTASGIASTAMGSYTTASGGYSIAAGQWITAGPNANTIALGTGVDDSNRMTNNTANSLGIGFNSTVPTLFVGPAAGVGSYGNIGIRTTTPATSAALEIAGTDGALLLPRLTTADQNALTGVNGMLIYNSETNKFRGRENGAWADLGGGDFMANGSVPMTGGLSVGTNGTNGYDVNLYGNIGAGSKMYWNASKAALRAGGATGAQWDAANTGEYSFASGYNTTASAWYSTAMGFDSTASGDISTAIGSSVIASGAYSFAAGRYVTAGPNDYAFAFGLGLDGTDRMVNNVANSLGIGFNSTVPTFFVGPGSGVGTYGKIGIGTTSPVSMLDLRGTFNVGLDGTSGHDVNLYGSSGAGARMYWNAAKAGLRAGRATGVEWDVAAIGNYSIGLGYNTTAASQGSVALGWNTTASGSASTATGDSTIASGASSTAMGTVSTASATYAAAIGFYASATGDSSMALGQWLTAGPAANAIAIGKGIDTVNRMVNNTTNSLGIGFNSTVPTLFVGPGSGIGTYGSVGIGTSSPSYLLHVNGSMGGRTLNLTNTGAAGDVLTIYSGTSGSGIEIQPSNGSTDPGLYVYNQNNARAVEIYTNNASSSNESMFVGTNSNQASGYAMLIRHAGTGAAALRVYTDSTSTQPVIEGEHVNGNGPLLTLKKAGADKMIVNNNGGIVTPSAPSMPEANAIYGPLVPKAWARFYGPSGSVTMVNGYNVASITSPSTGNYQINLYRAFADTNYVVMATAEAASAETWNCYRSGGTASAVTVSCRNGGTLAANSSGIHVVIFGNQ